MPETCFQSLELQEQKKHRSFYQEQTCTIGARIKERQKDHSKVLLESSVQKAEETVKKKDPQDNFLCCQAHQTRGDACGSVEQDD